MGRTEVRANGPRCGTRPVNRLERSLLDSAPDDRLRRLVVVIGEVRFA
jgi:hypothetical protein